MKKIIALVLAIMMIASMSLVVFAAESETYGEPATDNGIVDLNNENKDGTTKVDYKPVMGYEVVIPGDLELVENETTNSDGTTYYGLGKGPVAINKAKIPSDRKLELSVTGTNADVASADGYGWTLKDSNLGLNVMYNISLTDKGTTTNAPLTGVDETDIEQGDIVLYYISGKGFKAQSATMVFRTEQIITAGNFTDTLTFSAKVVAK